MKKTVCMLMVCLLTCLMLPASVVKAAGNDNDMRAVWISTVFNLDYPSTKNNISAQQSEFVEKLDTLQAMGINTVIVQVRPKADALYKSSINPWSDVLTGKQGQDPGYDPMAFMIQEAHKRGMAFHAWLNPYRVTTSGTSLTALCASHPARLNPSWTFSYNGKLYYNPELEAVKQHITETVKEIATKYDVDGIHFDDYFYPSNYPLPAGETRNGTVAGKRRNAVNDMVKRVSDTIKTVNQTYHKSIKFGISPPGIWKNSSSDSTGSKTSGNEAYYSVYADSRTWIQNGWIDYIVPQIYWQTGHSKADYETLVKWWSNEVAGSNVKLYIGQGVYTDAVAKQIDVQLAINKKYAGVKGSVYFSLRDLLKNRQGCKDKITSFYQQNALAGSLNQAGSDSTVNTISPSLNNQQTVSSAVGKNAVVTASVLNIRSGASTERPVITKVSQGTLVQVLDLLGGWYKVRLSDGTVGWASAAYLQ